MNTLFNMKNILKFKFELITAVSIITVAKLLATVAISYLPTSSLEYTGEKTEENYFLFNFPRAISISQEAIIEKPKASQNSSIALTMNNFLLKAVYAQEDGGGFIMVINNRTRKDRLVSRGDTYEGYVLKKILSKKAIFEKGGKEYELLLKEDKVTEVRTVKPDFPVSSKMDTKQQVDRVERSEVKRYRKNINLIQKEIRLAPHREGGKIAGFVITYVKQGSIFQKLGVQRGDRLIEANGLKLTSVKDALKLYKQIDKIKVFKMVLLRNGEERELEYEIY
ncbi:MAG: PDZ domain-containing protein [Campylobacterales bacterium]|nr:PDZ domain-containing protein [Campylobacterales bacterium]